MDLEINLIIQAQSHRAHADRFQAGPAKPSKHFLNQQNLTVLTSFDQLVLMGLSFQTLSSQILEKTGVEQIDHACLGDVILENFAARMFFRKSFATNQNHNAHLE